MQEITLNQTFQLDNKVVENMQNNFTAMMAYWTGHQLSVPYATRSYLKRADCQDSEYLSLPEYGPVIPRSFPIVNHKGEGKERLDGVMDTNEIVDWQKVKFPFEKEPVNLPREELVKSYLRFEFDVTHNPRRIVYYQSDDDEITFFSPLIALLNAEQGTFYGNSIAFERKQEFGWVDQWYPIDSPDDFSVLWLKDTDLTEASFVFRELPLSLGLSRFGESKETITSVHVPEELGHLDDLGDITHVDLEELLSP